MVSPENIPTWNIIQIEPVVLMNECKYVCMHVYVSRWVDSNECLLVTTDEVNLIYLVDVFLLYFAVFLSIP